MDDTDGLDPEAEFDQWRARELARLLREKQAQAAADEERAEIERRRAMPEEQRLAEDMAFAEETRNREKGEMGFLQKYYHKGAFHAVSAGAGAEAVHGVGWGGGSNLRLAAGCRVLIRRTTISSSATILARQRTRSTCRCYPRLCRSRTLAR